MVLKSDGSIADPRYDAQMVFYRFLTNADCSDFLEIRFLGGAREVGRSGILIRDRKNILLDYGIKVGEKVEYPLRAGKVDAVVLSHAHLDHSGNAPALYHYGMPAAFGTEPTLRLSELLIEDSIKVNRLKHERMDFTKADYRNFVRKYVSYGYGEPIPFDEYNLSLHYAGHICGSSITRIEKKSSGRSIVYTGDFKLSPQTLHTGADLVEGNILITESTYATREHPDRNHLISLFVDNIKKVIENKGVALIPVFAVGRAQEVLAILYKHGLIDYTYVDGMARKATDIILKYPEFTKDVKTLQNAVARSVRIGGGKERSDALNGESIIVTTAGMLNGGPALDYITKLNDTSMIFLTGYQAEDTNGRRLLDNKPLIIDGEKRFIRTSFAFYDLSAHAGRSDIFDFVKRTNPEVVVCVHGDEESTNSLREGLELEGFEAHAPAVNDALKLEF